MKLSETDRIKNALVNFITLATHSDYYNKDRDDKDIYLIKAIVKKETPKKPTEADVSEENSYCAWLCPTCGRTHINNYPLNYCSDCGQKIDWSDYEKYLREGEQEEN